MSATQGTGRIEGNVFTMDKKPTVPGDYHMYHFYDKDLGKLKKTNADLHQIVNVFFPYTFEYGKPPPGDRLISLAWIIYDSDQKDNFIKLVNAINAKEYLDPVGNFAHARLSDGDFNVINCPTVPGDYHLIHRYDPEYQRLGGVRDELNHIVGVFFPRTFEGSSDIPPPDNGGETIIELSWKIYKSNIKVTFVELVKEILGIV
jgi:hypothetical protein